MKMLAQKSVSDASKKAGVMKGIVANTDRIARLKNTDHVPGGPVNYRL